VAAVSIGDPGPIELPEYGCGGDTPFVTTRIIMDVD
jgi:hypothetical protein